MILNLSNFIYSLLLENETVVIPGFGAFISTYKPAVIHGDEITPPSKIISFTQQIKNNDGLLAEIIARKAKISQSYAMKRIEKARENMLYELDKGEKVIVENVGELFHNENNEIQFTPYDHDNLLLDSFGLEVISTEDFVKDVIESDPEIQNEFLAEVGKGSENENKNEPKIYKLPDFKPDQNKENQEKRKKAGWYWYLLILLPLLIGAYFIINKNSKSVNSESEIIINSEIQQEGIHVETVAPLDTVETDSVIETSSPKPAPTASPIPATERHTGIETNEFSKLYLVGGSFKSEENAEKYILQLKERNMEGFNLGKKGSLYLVGIGTFDTDAEAQNSLNTYLEKYPEWKLWIFKR